MSSNPPFTKPSDVSVVADLARAAHEPTRFDQNHAVMLVPDGYKVHDLRPNLPPAPWVEQVVSFDEADSFVDYVQHFRLPQTMVFFNAASASFRAVIDYHEHANARGRCAHVASFKAKFSLEALAWQEHSGKLLEQEEFARFLEKNLVDIVEPAAASMLEVALNLEVKKTATFSNAIRLDNGQRAFRYDETVRGGGTRAGDLAIPEKFKLNIPIFEGGPAQLVDAHLRYRLTDGELRIGYELALWQRVLDFERRQLRASISAKLGEDLPIYAGWV